MGSSHSARRKLLLPSDPTDSTQVSSANLATHAATSASVMPAAAHSVRMNGSATGLPKMGPGGWSRTHGSTGTLARTSIRHLWAAPASCRSATPWVLMCWKVSTVSATPAAR
jgi:hypothetical protein